LRRKRRRVSRLKDVISDDRIRDLIRLGNENRNLDYKGPFSWVAIGRDEKCSIAKDVLAFANTRDGGIILIGLDDTTHSVVGLSDTEASSFDQTTFNDFVHGYTEPRHTANVYRRILDGKNLVVIEIPEFSDVPIICKQTAQSTANPKDILLRKSALYKRTDKATSEIVDDADEMRELLNRALLRRQNDLMAAMAQIINPQQRPDLQLTSYDEEIAETDQFIGLRVGGLLVGGSWTVTFRPANYIRDRIPELPSVQVMVRESRVGLRGWDFPHFTPENDSNFARGFQSWVDWQSPLSRMTEAFRAYESGLFRWKGSLWEDTHPMYAGKNQISLVAIIFAFTEWLMFAQRYYERFLRMEDFLNFEFILDGAHNRALMSIPPSAPLLSRYTSQESRVIEGGTAVMGELRSDASGIARRYVRRVFEIFNWNTATDELIADWQKHIDGKY
jgi:hypothetical protein